MSHETMHVKDDVRLALIEDGAERDLTARLVPEAQVKAFVVCRESAVLCGSAWVDETFRQLDASVEVRWDIDEAELVTPNQTLCSIYGSAQVLLTGERTALNFLQTLSAVATHTKQYVDKVRGTRARILDTRKTIPGLRLAQKYAVTCGGGMNHRIGLHDGILIKENHIVAAGSITAAVEKARKIECSLLEVEVETLAELEEALRAGVKRVLLDNFSLDALREAVSINQQRAMLEASGGVNLETVADIAATGVDYISVGALTKDIKAIDLSMRFEES